ncbi:MAG: hypothetical protein NC184_05860 [Roseburia sp.]|nr:hypothetical protein [Roseburia sp.]
MITTKRQINRDRDRFGGYGTASDRSPLIDDDLNIVQNVEASSDIGYDDGIASENIFLQSNRVEAEPYAENMTENARPDVRPAQEEKPLYSTLDTFMGVKPRAQFDLPLQKDRKPLEHEDIMPSIKTRAYKQPQPVQHAEAEATQKRSAHRSLSPRTKVLLLVYVAVALVLAVAVIATGVSISGAQASVGRLSAHITEQQATVAEQATEIAALTDETHILERATASGMVQSSQPVYKVNAVEKVDVQKATPHTNGFDEFCDWMSGVVM